MTNAKNLRYFFVALLAVLVGSEAFTISSSSRVKTSLNAWSLQMPENLGSFKSTWYNEVQNPTGRPVYDE
jgi:hypothetical protein